MRRCTSPSAARARSSTTSGCASPGAASLDECVVACGLPHIGRGDLELALKEMAALQHKVAGFRRFGAASLDLAFVAAGRLAAHF
jgi:myo-inositol-1(or 4)-monophosphatase